MKEKTYIYYVSELNLPSKSAYSIHVMKMCEAFSKLGFNINLFVINHKDNSFLNHTSETSEGWGYAVYGSVIDGMDVVDQIALSTTSTVGGYADAPLEPTIINSITVSK